MFPSTRSSLARPVAVAAIALGVAFGSYGVAAAASGSSSSATATAATTTARTAATPGATAQNPWGSQRSDETVLTGDALAKVKAAALAKVGSDATIVRVETDADGHATYEAHLVKADGTAATVYVDASFDVVSVESR
jgi:hypothetical protein